jgi:glycosyltransferase involved in cell wall biosynthesis
VFAESYDAAVRLALYHPWIYLRGGAERMILEFVSRSRHDWTIYTHHYEPEATFAALRDLSVEELRPRVSVLRTLGPLARAASTIASARLPEDGARAVLVSSEGLGDLLLARNRLPAACYCHTPLKILHDPMARADLTRRDRPKALALGAIGPAYHLVERRLWRRYRHVMVNSEEVRSRVERGGLRPSGPVEVLHPGVNLERFPLNDGAREDFFLVASRMKWWKNIELAIDAFAAARRAGLTSTLLVAGAVDEQSEPYYRSLRARTSGLPVTFEVDPPEDLLAKLLGSCRALLSPTLNEDFGIVPLEAMASGTPVIAVDRGGPRETVLHGKTGWLVEPDPEAFAERMIAVERATDLAELRRAARARAAEFNWERFARRLDDVMESVVSAVPERA